MCPVAGSRADYRPPGHQARGTRAGAFVEVRGGGRGRWRVFACRVCWYRFGQVVPAAWLIAAAWSPRTGQAPWEFAGACALHATVRDQEAVEVER